MKRLGLATLALVAMGAAAPSAFAADMPVKAPPPLAPVEAVSGYVGVYGGATWADYYFTEDIGKDHRTAGLFGGEGRLNWWMTPAVSLQLDAEAEGTSNIQRACPESDCDISARGHGVVGGHLAWRDPSRGAIGVFGGGLVSSNLDNDGINNYAFGGVEAQAYWAAFTLYAQAGLIGRFAGAGDDVLDNGWFARLEGRYFFTPNDKLVGEVGYVSGSITDNDSGRQFGPNWGATYEHKLAGLPLSVFASYQGFWFKDSGNATCGGNRATENMVMVGLRLYVNEKTLQFNDRNGATFNLPKFRSLSWGDVVNEGDNSCL